MKRPILAAAIVTTMVCGLFCLLCPKIFYPSVPFPEEALLTMEGQVLQTVTHSETVDVYLSKVHISCEEGRQKDIQFGKAVLVLPFDEASDLSLKAGYKVHSYCTYRPFRTAANHGNFDEEEYYASMGIFVRADSVRTEIAERSVWIFQEALRQIRSGLVRSIYASVQDPETAGILAAICTGDRAGLTKETKSLYQKSGIIHILAISGLHISLLGMTLFRLLRKRLRNLPAAGIAVFVMLGFCVMSDASASAVRATIMFVIQMTGICLGKQVDILCSWAAAFLIMVCWRPLLLTSSGFLLSFLAVLAVGTLFPSMCGFMGIVRTAGYEMKDVSGTERAHGLSAKKILGKKLTESFLMSLSVNLLLLPVMACVYYEISVYAILLNLLVIPLMSAVLGLGFISAILGLIRVILGRFFAGAGVYLVWFIRWCCTLSKQLPASSVIAGCPEPWRLILYYTVLLTAHSIFLRQSKARPAVSAFRKTTFLIPLIGTLLIILLAGKTPHMLRISFFDVGQGDGILIENPNGTVYLLDGGSSSVTQVGQYRLESAIQYYGISYIDYSIISHPDADHYNGVLEILSGMPDKGEHLPSGTLAIGSILMPYVPNNPNYSEISRLAEKKGVEVIDLKAGIQIKDGNLTLTCLWPEKGQTFDTANGYSAVLDLKYGEFTALMTGDLEAESETRLLQEHPTYLETNYDVLKVAHHGSRFSSSEAFLQKVKPTIAIISAGEKNHYGHPHKETLQRLQNIGANILVTAETQEIILETNLQGSLQIHSLAAPASDQP